MAKRGYRQNVGKREWLYRTGTKWILLEAISGASLDCSTLRGLSMRNRMRLAVSLGAMLLSLALLTATDTQGKSKGSKVVYVCACLQTRSCSCMTEAKMEGPCACGTEGGPPLKAVAADSDWAKQNREELAK